MVKMIPVHTRVVEKLENVVGIVDLRRRSFLCIWCRLAGKGVAILQHEYRYEQNTFHSMLEKKKKKG